MLHIHQWSFTLPPFLFLYPFSLFPPPSPSPHRKLIVIGNMVQERVEQAIEEIKDRLAFLEKRGRAEVRGELVFLYLL